MECKIIDLFTRQEVLTPEMRASIIQNLADIATQKALLESEETRLRERLEA